MMIMCFRGETGDNGIYRIATSPYSEAAYKNEGKEWEGQSIGINMRNKSSNRGRGRGGGGEDKGAPHRQGK